MSPDLQFAGGALTPLGDGPNVREPVLPCENSAGQGGGRRAAAHGTLHAQQQGEETDWTLPLRVNKGSLVNKAEGSL
jgi:hypothetical protein